MSNTLALKISYDLNLKKFEMESEEEYGNRLLYSALVAWARVLVLGISYTDLCVSNDIKLDYISVDIMHIQTRLSKVAFGMLNTLQYKNEWIKNFDLEVVSNEFASKLIRQMFFCYELSKLNNRRVTLSPKQVIFFKNKHLIRGGYTWQEKNLYTVGIGRWLYDYASGPNYKENFGIPLFSSSEYYTSLINDAIWVESELSGTYQIFKVGTKLFSNAWANFYNSIVPKGLSLMRSLETDGGYFLIRNDEDRMLVSKLDKWYYDEKEIYRIMYILNEVNNTRIVFKAQNYTDHIVLHCRCGLPNAEMRLLFMSSWPQKTYDDFYYRIIPKFLWDDVKQSLNDLGIIIKYVNLT